MSIDPSRTAVVLIEYQNDFTSEGGALHGAVAGVMERRGCSTTRARSSRPRVPPAPPSCTRRSRSCEGFGELADHPYGILKGVVDSTAFVKGSWGAEIVDALAPQRGDIVVEGKRGLDAFATTNLDFILRAAGSRRSRSAASSPTAASSRRCGPATRRATRW